MVRIEFKGVSKTFGRKKHIKKVIEDMSFEVAHGDFFGIIGSSGAGKTTVMRMIAGLEEPTEGDIYFDNTPVASAGKILVPVEERNIGMVFQTWALYPHLTNFENIAFPLRSKHMSDREIREKVMYLAELLNIKEALGSKPGKISGGQQQRVAVCRALAKDPSLLLLDEPFSNLDATIKDSARSLVRTVQKELGITAIVVSHDPADIFALARNTLTISRGINAQTGPTEELYHHPKSLEVARAIGEINVLPGRLEISDGQTAVLMGENYRINIAEGEIAGTTERTAGSKILVGIRPEEIRLFPKGAVIDQPGWSLLGNASVSISSYSTGVFRVLFNLQGIEKDVATTSEVPIERGAAVAVAFKRSELKFFDTEGKSITLYRDGMNV